MKCFDKIVKMDLIRLSVEHRGLRIERSAEETPGKTQKNKEHYFSEERSKHQSYI